MRDCWVLKRLISKNYFLTKPSISSIKYKTVKDHFGTVETSHYYGGYEDSCSDSESENEENSVHENYSSFEREFEEMEKRSKEVGFISSEKSDDEIASKKSVNLYSKILILGC